MLIYCDTNKTEHITLTFSPLRWLLVYLFLRFHSFLLSTQRYGILLELFVPMYPRPSSCNKTIYQYHSPDLKASYVYYHEQIGIYMDTQSARVIAVVVISGQISVFVFLFVPLSAVSKGAGQDWKKMMSHICVCESGFRGFYFNQNMMTVCFC